MEVLIVGRTRMAGNARCIGGIASDGTSIRLLRADGLHWDASIDFQVGQVWDLTYTVASNPVPPHVEDVVVTGSRHLRDLSDLSRCLCEGIQPWRGGVDQLFDGLVRFTGNDNGYICHRVGVPTRSTWFWVPDRDLVLGRTAGTTIIRSASGCHVVLFMWASRQHPPDCRRAPLQESHWRVGGRRKTRMWRSAAMCSFPDGSDRPVTGSGWTAPHSTDR